MVGDVMQVLVGSLAIIVGLVFIVFRKNVSRRYARILAESFGKPGLMIADGSKPGRYLAMGIGLLIMGSVLLVTFFSH
jgi:hypothetical protein